MISAGTQGLVHFRHPAKQEDATVPISFRSSAPNGRDAVDPDLRRCGRDHADRRGRPGDVEVVGFARRAAARRPDRQVEGKGRSQHGDPAPPLGHRTGQGAVLGQVAARPGKPQPALRAGRRQHAVQAVHGDRRRAGRHRSAAGHRAQAAADPGPAGRDASWGSCRSSGW